MAIPFHPDQGTIVICDFNTGFKVPEMKKRRPAIIISKRLRDRKNLCTLVPFSTSKPKVIRPYHYELILKTPLPKPYNSINQWVKADMLYTVSLSRLFLPFEKKDAHGQREYDIRIIEGIDFKRIQQCVLHGIGLGNLTKEL